mgnify:CR=1 FL=1
MQVGDLVTWKQFDTLTLGLVIDVWLVKRPSGVQYENAKVRWSDGQLTELPVEWALTQDEGFSLL